MSENKIYNIEDIMNFCRTAIPFCWWTGWKSKFPAKRASA